MGMKFLNKKGWHTGSLRNIENVWKAEQKHDAEQKKLEELRKQIHEERERAEFRQLQEQAGLVPRQERLDFLYESGLAVGKGSSSFKALESLPKTDPVPAATSSSAAAVEKQPAGPGVLFEDKPQSANDAWRKLHSDPLLLIRQREQEALARVKNNPVQMAMIRKSVESKKDNSKKKHKTKKHLKKSKHQKHSSSESDSDSEANPLNVNTQKNSHKRGSRSDKPSRKAARRSDEESSGDDARRKKYNEKEYKHQRPSSNQISHPSQISDEELSEGDTRRKKYHDKEYKDQRPTGQPHPKNENGHADQISKRGHRSNEESREEDAQKKKYYDKEYKDQRPSALPYSKYDKRQGDHASYKSNHDSKRKEYSSKRQIESRYDNLSHINSSDKPPRNESNNRRRNHVKLSEEERAAKLREMQMDAEQHEEQRWKRLKKAEEIDAKEAVKDHTSAGRNFLDAANKSVYGTVKGGSSTIEESVRRRTHYLQQGESATESNAFRR